MSVHVHIDPSLPIIPEVDYVLRQLSRNTHTSIQQSSSGVLIGTSDQAIIRISKKFIDNYRHQKFSHAENLGNSGFVELVDGTPDYLSTAFYMLACLQEYDPSNSRDKLGRFHYPTSYQAKFKNAHQNIVQLCFDKLAAQLSITPAKQRSRFFLSHDIDTVNGALFQDGFYAVKKGRIDILLRLIMNTAIGKPDWLNMDQIMKLESMHDCISTFFWIVKRGKAEDLENADYDFNSSRIQKIINSVEKNGFHNGIHKSISMDSFETELNQFTQKPLINRYHYLKFNLPSGFDAIEESGLAVDTSLGFAENVGFRNSYGLPYNPYNIATRKPYSFLEVPLHIMDTTLFKYKRANIQEAKATIFNFFEANKTNCILSVLWHNNFFTNYKYDGYLNLYKEILAYIRDNKFETLGVNDLSAYSIVK